jgi:hypothetical protein
MAPCQRGSYDEEDKRNAHSNPGYTLRHAPDPQRDGGRCDLLLTPFWCMHGTGWYLNALMRRGRAKCKACRGLCQAPLRQG